MRELTPIRTGHLTCGLCLLTLIPMTVFAQEHAGGDNLNFNHGWGVGVNFEYTDNVDRVPDNKMDETSGAVSLRYDFGAARRSFLFKSAADVEYRNYFGGLHEDGPSGGVTASTEYQLIDKYWNVHAAEHYGQTRTDLYQVNSPNNRGYINELSGGTDIVIPIGRRFSMFASADAADVSYGESEADSVRTDLSGGLRQAVSERTSVYATVSRSGTNLKADNPGPTAIGDYDIEEASIGFDADLSKTTISISGGQTRVRGQAPGGRDAVTPDSSLFRATIERRIGTRFALSLGIGTEYTDTGQTFVREQQAVGVESGGANIAISADPYKSDYATLGISFTGARFGVQLHNSYRRERHEFHQELAGKYFYTQLSMQRTFTPRTSAYFRGAYSRNESLVTTPTAATDLSDTDLSVGMSLHPSRRVTLDFYAAANLGSTPAYNYQENRIGITLSYAPPVAP